MTPRLSTAHPLWLVGAADSIRDRSDAASGCLVLRTKPDEHHPFASTSRIITQLEGEAGPRLRGLLAAARAELRDQYVRPLESNPAYLAALRRVSRESLDTVVRTDRLARLILEALIDKNITRVVVPAVDRIDRTTIKVLARCVQLQPGTDGVAWEWHLAYDPGTLAHTTSDDPAAMWLVTRDALLTRLRGLLNPIVVDGSGRHRSQHAEQTVAVSPAGIQDMGQALVAQNYDACFLWAGQHPDYGTNRGDGVNLWRVTALAAANTGQIDTALCLLGRAYKAAAPATLRAHLAYMQGLVVAKRHFDIATSDRWYSVGLNELDAVRTEDPGDPLTERAWIFNGLALNRLLAARVARSDVGTVARETFELLRRAFDLVRDGSQPDRIYLRFNLLRNMSFFLEYQGQFDLAIKTWSETFSNMLPDGSGLEHAWRATVDYRLGYLHYRAGRLDDAAALLENAHTSIERVGCPFRSLRTLASIGSVALGRSDFQGAERAFAAGLQRSLDVRMPGEAARHARGLIATAMRTDNSTRARELLAWLASDETAVWETLGYGERAEPGQVEPPEVSSGLTTEFPEIDLESTPAMPVERVLAGAR